ncbi:MAG: DUF5131 family protein [Ruminococcus sp.]|nr:DUF5131 family protein [Ruminococcus sp.]
MHDIWNPWHGCVKISEGCENCYMYFLDRMRDRNGRKIYRTQNFDYPLKTDRKGNYKIKSGEKIRVCMTSDFFLEEADPWRNEAWEIMKIRSDVIFYLLTKRPERVMKCLPEDWGTGWENIFFNVTAENQARADQRIPLLLELPFKHKGVMCAPFIGRVSLAEYLPSGQIQQVVCGGENYDGARPCNYEWVKLLRKECEEYDISFTFMETGTKFIKDKKLYTLPDKRLQAEMAYKSGISYRGKPQKYKLTDGLGIEIPEEWLYRPYFREGCHTCGSKPICNGCSKCGKCK